MTAKPLQCSASAELYASVEAAATRDGLTVSAWVRSAVEARLRTAQAHGSIADVQRAAIAGGGYDDYDEDHDEPAADVQEPPGQSAVKLCRGCDREFAPHHQAAQYCPACKAEQGPKECQICGGKCQHRLCQNCYACHRNADWLVRQFIRFKMYKSEQSYDMGPVDKAFRRWAHVDLNVATILDKADGTPAYHLPRELKEAGYRATECYGGVYKPRTSHANVFGTVTGVSAA
jgi:hypothetical protein